MSIETIRAGVHIYRLPKRVIKIVEMKNIEIVMWLVLPI